MSITASRPVEAPPQVGRRPLTLAFRDAALELRYVTEMAGPSLSQIRFGAASSAVLWLIAGFVADFALEIEPVLAYGVSGTLVVVNLIVLGLLNRFTKYNQHQTIVVGTTTLATLGAIVLTIASDTFVAYGALALMLIAFYAFVVFQLRFVFTVVASMLYVLIFVGFSLGIGSPATVTQTFLVGSALLTGTIGSRAIEASGRDRFQQRIEIASLKDEVERLLRRYLSPNVAEVVLADPSVSELGGRVEEVSVLFADLEGFTAMSHLADPEQVAQLLNRYFELVVPTVLDEGGSVMSFGGDAVMAVFNAPTPCPDHAIRASRAALRIQAAIADLHRVPGLEHAPPFRIGVNTGRALVGNVGSDEMRTFTVIGDAVNIASRLQTHAGAGSVLIGPETFTKVGSGAEIRRLEPVMLKGLPEPVQPYELVGLN